MCGIVGFLGSPAEGSASERVKNMADRLAHRGPDAEGFWLDDAARIALGHRRLSILDLTPTGAQPMASAGGRYVVTFNGEIYNFQDLRADLEKSGHQFRGGSDTEVILAAFHEWGIEHALSKFNGMFAMGVWDRAERRLTLARDRFGEKPLYYGWLDNGALVFASELKAFAGFTAKLPPLSREGTVLFLRHNYIPQPFTIYQGIFKLPPASFLVVDERSTRPWPREYWAHSRLLSLPKFEGTVDDAEAELARLIDDSVRMRMVADVPVGAFLSGGVDSTLVVAAMQRQSKRPVRTFSIGFHDVTMNEADHAKEVAAVLGSDHTELYLSEKECLDLVPELPTLYDEPFADSSQIPTYFVSRVARAQVTVSLSGDGGDELWGGYPRYLRLQRLWNTIGRLPQSARAAAAAALGLAEYFPPSAIQLFRMHRGATRMHQLSQLLQRPSVGAVYQTLMSQWERPEAILQGPGEVVSSPLVARWDEAEGRTLMERMLYTDQMTFLPEDILAKVDRAAMAVSLETRVPLLDPRIAELAWSLPPEMRVGREGKHLLKRILRKTIPSHLANYPKRGFSVPLERWLREGLRDWAESLLDEKTLREGGIFRPEVVRKKWREHVRGVRRWEFHLWDVLMFGAWHRAWKSSIVEKRPQSAQRSDTVRA